MNRSISSSKNFFTFVYLLLFFLFVLLMSFHSPVGSHHLDEYYQIIEFASYRMGITEVHYLPWEFTERIRSWLQPVIAEYFIKSGFVLGFSVLNILWFYRIVHGLFAFSSLVFISSILSKRDNVPIQLFLTAICTSYFLPFYLIRSASESFSVVLFIFGLGFFLRNNSNGLHDKLLCGLFWGLAFFARFHISFFTIGFFLWALWIKELKQKDLARWTTGVLLAFVICIVLDSFCYQSLVFTPYQYVKHNIFLKKASEFGVESWYWYMLQIVFANYFWPFSIVLVLIYICFVLFHPKHVLTWVTMPFLAAHFFTAHKEMRFLSPVLFFLPFTTTILIKDIKDRWHFTSHIFFVIGVLYIPIFCWIMPYWLTSNMWEQLVALEIVGRNIPDGQCLHYKEDSNIFNLLGFRIRFIEKSLGKSIDTKPKCLGSQFYVYQKIRLRDPEVPGDRNCTLLYEQFPIFNTLLKAKFLLGKKQETILRRRLFKCAQ